MSYMFYNAIYFNQYIGEWDTSQVTDMSYMFYNAKAFNEDIGKWNTDQVTNMSYMFYNAITFKSYDRRLKWKTSKVTDMSYMFYNAIAFNEAIGTWNTSRVTNMSYMFYNAISFNRYIGDWNTRNVTNMSHMFDNAKSFTGYITGYIEKWDPNIVTDISHINIKQADSYEEPSRTSSDLHMMIPPPASTTTFKGTPWTRLVGMLYLLHKYPTDCVAIPLSASGKDLTDYVLDDVFLHETSICWHENIEDFVIPNGLWSSIKKCLDKGSNFIIIPLGFVCKNTGHANFLIYDSKTKELERFEPYGFMPGVCLNPPNLDKKLADLLNSNVQVDMVKKVYEPLSFCPKISFQILQDREFEQQIGDPGGFCAVWVIWYADVRLENPNKTRKQVVEMALLKFKNNIGSMTEFIRSYSDFIVKGGERLKISKAKSVLRRLQ